tara:strand:+ start:63 stop:1298 length:1236 start_codon:yes stop_codon:yes gene_type:complete
MELLMSLQPHVRQLKPRNESTVNHIEKVQKLYEGSTEAAKEMEYVLVHAAGGKQESEYKNLKKYTDKLGFDEPLDVGKKIIDGIGLTGKGGYMAASGKITSKKWSDGTPQWTGTNVTPKTDIVLGNKKVSLKKGSSQLMSGGPAESMSTFRAAVENTSSFDLTNLAKEVEDGIRNLLPSTVGEFMGGADLQKTGGTVYKNTRQKKGKIGDVAPGTFDKDKVLSAADKHNQQLKKKFAQLFAENIEFKKNFVYEAMTGAVKFDKGPAAADWFLVVDFDGSHEMNVVKSADDPYVSKVLSKVKPDVKFKSTAVKKKIDGKDTKTGHYRFWSVVGLGYKAAVKNLNNAYEDYENGELLQEGFFDKVKKIFKRFQQFLSRVFMKMKKFITTSVNNMAEFLGVEPIIKFNNNINWK